MMIVMAVVPACIFIAWVEIKRGRNCGIWSRRKWMSHYFCSLNWKIVYMDKTKTSSHKTLCPLYNSMRHLRLLRHLKAGKRLEIWLFERIDNIQHRKMQEILNSFYGQNCSIPKEFWHFQSMSSKNWKASLVLQAKIKQFHAWNGFHFSWNFQCCMWSIQRFPKASKLMGYHIQQNLVNLLKIEFFLMYAINQLSFIILILSYYYLFFR